MAAAMRCRVCGLEGTNGVCPVCGFDEGLDWENCPTLAVGEPTLSLAGRRKRWSETEGEALRCVRCGGVSFSIFPGKGNARCCTCGSLCSLDVREPAAGPGSGRPTGRAPEADGNSGWKCSCGFLNSGDVRTCGNCGHTRGAAPVPKPLPRRADDSWRCSCGASNSGSRRYCSACDMPRRVAKVPRPADDSWLCPCGTRNSGSSRYCKACDRPRR